MVSAAFARSLALARSPPLMEERRAIFRGSDETHYMQCKQLTPPPPRLSAPVAVARPFVGGGTMGAISTQSERESGIESGTAAEAEQTIIIVISYLTAAAVVIIPPDPRCLGRQVGVGLEKYATREHTRDHDEGDDHYSLVSWLALRQQGRAERATKSTLPFGH